MKITFVIISIIFFMNITTYIFAESAIKNPPVLFSKTSVKLNQVDRNKIKKLIYNNISDLQSFSDISAEVYPYYLIACLFYKNSGSFIIKRINFNKLYDFVSLKNNYEPTSEDINTKTGWINTKNTKTISLKNIDLSKIKILIMIVHPVKFNFGSSGGITNIAQQIYNESLNYYKPENIAFLYGLGNKPSLLENSYVNYELMYGENYDENYQALYLNCLSFLDESLVKKMLPASKDYMLKYLQAKNLEGVFYNGDGCSSGLATQDWKIITTIDIQNLIKEKQLNFSKTDIVAAACNAFLAPFGKTIVESADAKLYMAGITEIMSGISSYLLKDVFCNLMKNRFNNSSFKNLYLDSKNEALTKFDNTNKSDKNKLFYYYTDKTIYSAGIFGIAGHSIPDLFPNYNTSIVKISSLVFNENYSKFSYKSYIPPVNSLVKTSTLINQFGVVQYYYSPSDNEVNTPQPNTFDQVNGKDKGFLNDKQNGTFTHFFTDSDINYNSQGIFNNLGFQVFGLNNFTGTPVSNIETYNFNSGKTEKLPYSVPWWILYYQHHTH